jgi:hypothetical protein
VETFSTVAHSVHNAAPTSLLLKLRSRLFFLAPSFFHIAVFRGGVQREMRGMGHNAGLERHLIS